METCTRCGADTELYYHNVRICLQCSDALEYEIQQRDSQIAKHQLARPEEIYLEDLEAIGPALVIGVGQVQGSPEYRKRSA